MRGLRGLGLEVYGVGRGLVGDDESGAQGAVGVGGVGGGAGGGKCG